MGLLVPLSNLSIEDKKCVKGMNKRWIQYKCVVAEYENIGGNSGDSVSTNTFQEKYTACMCNTPDGNPLP